MTLDATATLILLGLIPGWIFWKRRSRHGPRTSRSGLVEALELLAVGVLTTGVGLVVWVLVDGADLPFVLSASRWAELGDQHLQRHLAEAAITLGLVVGLSSLLGYLLSLAVYGGKGEHDADGLVWWNVFKVSRPEGTSPYVGVMMDDGLLVEGFMLSFTTDGTAPGRDVALAAPIRVTAKGIGASGVMQPLSSIVIPERVVRYVTVRHVNPADAALSPAS